MELHAVRKIMSIPPEDHEDFDKSVFERLKDLIMETYDPDVKSSGKKAKYATHPRIG